MRHAIIENGKVVNIAVADLEFGASQGWIQSDVAQIGDTYENGQFVTPPPPPPPVPQVVSMRQARLAMLQGGLLDSVDAAIAAMTGAEGKAAQIEWEYATEVKRDAPLVSGMQASLGMTADQIDDLFRLAGTL